MRIRPYGDHQYLPELIGLTEIASMLGVSKQRAGRLAQSVGFPRPVASLAMGPVYVRQAVVDFAKARDRTVGR